MKIEKLSFNPSKADLDYWEEEMKERIIYSFLIGIVCGVVVVAAMVIS